MPDNTRINPGSGGDLIATDEIGGIKHQRVKVQHGVDGSATDVSSSSPLPVQVYNPLSQFGELLVSERTPVLSINSALPLSTLRNVMSTSGAASISATSAPGEVELALTANGADAATLASRRAGHYTPGFSAQMGSGVRRPVAPAGSQSWAVGLFDDDDGFFLRETSAGLAFVIRKGGVDTAVLRAAWNGDPLDGTGASGLTLNLVDGVIVEIDFTWYGYGAIQLFFVIDTIAGQQRVLAHTAVVAGASTRNPNLPVSASVENGGTATAYSLFLGGRQYSVQGRDYSEERITSVRRLALGSVGTTYLPLLSVRARLSTPRVQFGIDSMDVISDADALVSLWLNPTLTGAAFAGITGVPTTDTLLEADVSASALADGLLLWEGLVAGSAANNRNINTIAPLDFGASGTITLAVRRVTGVNAVVSAVARFRERW